MTRINPLIMALALSTCLSGCEGRGEARDKVLGEKPVVRSEEMFDHERFIADGAERQKIISKYGPVTLDTPDVDMHTLYRETLNRQDPQDHVSLHDETKDFVIDLNVEQVEIRTFAQMLSKVTGLNILVSDEVQGTVSAKLEQVPWTRALDSILKIKGLAKYVDNKSGIIRIHDQKRITEIEDFEKNRGEAIQKMMALEKSSQPVFTEVFKLFYTDPTEVKTTLEGVLADGKELPGAAQMTVDKRTNQLVVKARRDEMEMISKLIKKMDVRTKQVLIEAFIVEVTDDFEKALGTRLGLHMEEDAANALDGRSASATISGLAGDTGSTLGLGNSIASASNLPLAGPFGGIGIVAGIGSARDLKLELTAMEQEGLTKVISNPRVFTLDNQEAVIFQGEEIPFATVSQSGTEIQFKEAGLKLVVTPSVVGDGNIVMDIAVNKDTADTSQANPPITKREIKTSLVSRDGSIVVIGGIYTETESGSIQKVPLFGDLPGIKHLFRRKEDADNRKELMIFIAPQII